VDKIQVGRFTVRIEQDHNAESPAEDQDNGLFIVAGHRDFYVPAPGEKRVAADFQEYVDRYAATHWIIPIEAYIHSGVRLYLSGGCQIDRQWDVSQVGAVFAAKSEWRLAKSARKAAAAHVEYWNQYLSGDVWGYIVEDENGERVASCWGFFGREDVEAEGRRAAECALEAADRIPTLHAIS
jgi:hypothetical protein